MKSDSRRGTLLDLELLRTFDTVLHFGSFTVAAEQLHKTQSTVSTHIRRLEELTGSQLLERNNQGIVLTGAGEAILGYARRLLALNEEAIASVGAAELSGRVRVGIPADYTTTFLAEALPAFGHQFPHVELAVQCDLSHKLQESLARGELDLIIGTFDERSGGGEIVRVEPLVWAGALGGNAWTREPLPLAVFPRGCRFREIALERLAPIDRESRIAYTSPGMAGIEVAVLADFAIAPVTRSSLRNGMRALGEDEGLPGLPAIEVTLQSSTKLSDPARQFAQFILTD